MTEEGAGQQGKIELVFIPERETKRTIMFREQVVDGQQQWSDEDVAIGPLYVKKQALETGFDIESTKIKKLKVTLEVLESE